MKTLAAVAILVLSAISTACAVQTETSEPSEITAAPSKEAPKHAFVDHSEINRAVAKCYLAPSENADCEQHDNGAWVAWECLANDPQGASVYYETCAPVCAPNSTDTSNCL